MDATMDPNIPQWKRDLIQRIRNKNKWFLDSSDEQEQQLLAGNTSAEVGRTVQQPNLTCSSSSAAAVVVVPVAKVSDSSTRQCTEDLTTMVKDRVIDCDLENYASSDTEELHYGPGIVKKLKNHYLSLTLRECNQVRPSILPLRKATSLENLLDDGEATNNKPSMHYSRYKPRKENESKNFTYTRYYNASRGVDLKRAYSVETISRSVDEQHDTDEPLNDIRVKHQSFHEDILIVTEGNGVSENIHDNTALTSKETKPFSNTVNHKINRPKRITPLMSEKEKPPVDVVKQTKRIFEGKAEERTKQPYQTGDVAAKVASFKNIIQTKNHQKPPVKQKPVVSSTDNRKSDNTQPKQLPLENGWKNDPQELNSPPDVSIIASPREENNHSQPNLSETPDLILHSSPVKNVHSPSFRILATDNFLKSEVVHSNNFWVSIKNSLNDRESEEADGVKHISTESRNNIRKAGSTMTFNMPNLQTPRTYLPTISKKEPRTSPTITNITQRKQVQENKTDNFKVVSPVVVSPPLISQEIKKNKNVAKTTPKENTPPPTTSSDDAEKRTKKTPLRVNTSMIPSLDLVVKNHVNNSKIVPKVHTSTASPLDLAENVKNMEVKKNIQVPKSSVSRMPQEQNSIVFKFTNRRDVPDYVHNDGRIRAGKIEKPKVGEGGIILLPGVPLDESLVDDEDDWMLILEGPPSPCNVEFINSNILIDGRSSLNQKSRKPKMRIQFVDTSPEIFEYPSEASLASEYKKSASPLKETPAVTTSPTLGSSLANYIPKVGSTEGFQLGITRSTPIASVQSPSQSEVSYQEQIEPEKPLIFSAGTNSDILF